MCDYSNEQRDHEFESREKYMGGFEGWEEKGEM